MVNSLIESFSFLDSEKTTFKTIREDLIVKNLLGKSVTVDLIDVQLALVSQGAGDFYTLHPSNIRGKLLLFISPKLI